jgi:hypothetical protein
LLNVLTSLGCEMNSCRIVYVCTLAVFIALAGCGGKQTNFNNVTVTVSPTAATIPTGGQTSLTATVTGLPGGASPALNWTITELTGNGASGAQCTWIAGGTPPSGPCPDGTIEMQSAMNETAATYFAPGAAGTFHVNVQWSSISNPPVIKSAMATIIVTP